jgi:vacuolar-type H+-ATPase subunit I/STV1
MLSIADQFKKFMESKSTNTWIESDIFHVYVRKGRRYINGVITNTIDIANILSIPIEHRGKGYFKSFILNVESYGLPVYVECIHNPLLITMLSKHGYQLLPSDDIHMIKYPVDV